MDSYIPKNKLYSYLGLSIILIGINLPIFSLYYNEFEITVSLYQSGKVGGMVSTCLVLGGFFVARDLGWISSELSFWPVALLALGVYLLTSKLRKKDSC